MVGPTVVVVVGPPLATSVVVVVLVVMFGLVLLILVGRLGVSVGVLVLVLVLVLFRSFDNLLELQVRDHLTGELPMEPDLQRWMAVWGAPGL